VSAATKSLILESGQRRSPPSKGTQQRILIGHLIGYSVGVLRLTVFAPASDGSLLCLGRPLLCRQRFGTSFCARFSPRKPLVRCHFLRGFAPNVFHDPFEKVMQLRRQLLGLVEAFALDRRPALILEFHCFTNHASTGFARLTSQPADLPDGLGGQLEVLVAQASPFGQVAQGVSVEVVAMSNGSALSSPWLSDSVSPAAVRTARTWAERSPGFSSA